MIQAHCISRALYFYYYYISPTTEHQALDPRDWDLCLRGHRMKSTLQEHVLTSCHYFMNSYSGLNTSISHLITTEIQGVLV